MKKQYKVTIYVPTPYSTIVKAKSEEKAIEKALEREGPEVLAHWDYARDYSWQPEGLMEWPNLGKDQIPDVEEE